jgi:hypothetical protein
VASNFLFTWSQRVWPYENLRPLIDDFEAGRAVIEGWQCAAYRSIKKGDRAYVLKPGKGPCGVFGIAVVDGPAQKSFSPSPGRGNYSVPLKFETLLDPTNGFLVTKDELLRLGAAASLLNTRRSGVRLKPAAIASVIDERADKVHTLDDFVQGMNASKGQGRGLTGPERKLVENEAMRQARQWLEAEGFEFKDVSKVDSCDFRARRRGEEWVIEVKGTTGGPKSVLLTANEVALHVSNHPRNALLIVHGIALSEDGTSVHGGELLAVAPWALEEDRLKPVCYEYRVNVPLVRAQRPVAI